MNCFPHRLAGGLFLALVALAPMAGCGGQAGADTDAEGRVGAAFAGLDAACPVRGLFEESVAQGLGVEWDVPGYLTNKHTLYVYPDGQAVRVLAGIDEAENELEYMDCQAASTRDGGSLSLGCERVTFESCTGRQESWQISEDASAPAGYSVAHIGRGGDEEGPSMEVVGDAWPARFQDNPALIEATACPGRDASTQCVNSVTASVPAASGATEPNVIGAGQTDRCPGDVLLDQVRERDGEQFVHVRMSYSEETGEECVDGTKVCATEMFNLYFDGNYARASSFSKIGGIGGYSSGGGPATQNGQRWLLGCNKVIMPTCSGGSSAVDLGIDANEQLMIFSSIISGLARPQKDYAFEIYDTLEYHNIANRTGDCFRQVARIKP